jgi:DNA-binding transcriptional ArsR family regulator
VRRPRSVREDAALSAIYRADLPALCHPPASLAAARRATLGRSSAAIGPTGERDDAVQRSGPSHGDITGEPMTRKRPPTRQERADRRATLRPHPLRDQILDVMRSYGQPISPTRLARITGGSLGSTAYHVRTLVAAGVVELADEGRVRGAVEHFYALVKDPDDELRLDDPVRQALALADALTLPDAAGGYPTPTVLDAQARAELDRLLHRFRKSVHKIALDSTRRAG